MTVWKELFLPELAKIWSRSSFTSVISSWFRSKRPALPIWLLLSGIDFQEAWCKSAKQLACPDDGGGEHHSFSGPLQLSLCICDKVWWYHLCHMYGSQSKRYAMARNQGGAGGTYELQNVTLVNPSYQFYQINNNTLTTSVYMPLLAQTDPITLYPFVTVLPSGKVLVISGALTRFYT